LKASVFEYVRARSLDEVFTVLSEHGDEAKILAGGQSLIPTMNMRFTAPEVLVDVSGVADLQGIQVKDGVLRIGAMSRHADVLNSSVVAEHAPLIAKAMPSIAHATVRNRGTFGGSLCHADPAAELAACALALDARFNIRGPGGARTASAEEFFLGAYTTCLAKDEILLSVDVPTAVSGSLTFFDEVARRNGDYAMAGLAATTKMSEGHLADTRLVFFAVGDVALSATAAAELMDGNPAAAVDTEAVCDAIAKEIQPVDDLTTSGSAKLAMMKVLVRRAVNIFAQEEGA